MHIRQRFPRAQFQPPDGLFASLPPLTIVAPQLNALGTRILPVSWQSFSPRVARRRGGRIEPRTRPDPIIDRAERKLSDHRLTTGLPAPNQVRLRARTNRPCQTFQSQLPARGLIYVWSFLFQPAENLTPGCYSGCAAIRNCGTPWPPITPPTQPASRLLHDPVRPTIVYRFPIRLGRTRHVPQGVLPGPNHHEL
ncbi:hypothetical protein BDY21DRAFT_1859 [Lineolata rhizophorae]|uniref:Uncharacterized protein n=1 Tax=Lineolata rhizophorae TaxID=578093 RepID=A0A6A6PCY1_9PEZI|nr:hypothetical protein BDY21DRAFT_1859 [Lineolata rhizophorae]